MVSREVPAACNGRSGVTSSVLPRVDPRHGDDVGTVRDGRGRRLGESPHEPRRVLPPGHRDGRLGGEKVEEGVLARGRRQTDRRPPMRVLEVRVRPVSQEQLSAA
jgi:hypothetical protein